MGHLISHDFNSLDIDVSDNKWQAFIWSANTHIHTSAECITVSVRSIKSMQFHFIISVMGRHIVCVYMISCFFYSCLFFFLLSFALRSFFLWINSSFPIELICRTISRIACRTRWILWPIIFPKVMRCGIKFIALYNQNSKIFRTKMSF